MVAAARQVHPLWPSDEEAVLARLYPDESWVGLLQALPGRTQRAIWNRAHKLGLKREQRDYPPEVREKYARLARENKPRLGKVLYPVIERDGVPSKCCRACNEWLPLARFARKPDCSGGVRNRCTTCDGRWAYKYHRDTVIKSVRNYQKRHPEKVRLQKQASERRRHGRKMAGRGVSTQELRDLLEAYGGICAYCRVADADTIDHVMPLARGGHHEIENILPACRACNFEKHTMTLDEWQVKKG